MKKIKIAAFTLVELMVVISVILVLSTFTYIQLSKTQAKSRDDKRLADVQLISTALDQYAMDHSRNYPNSAGGPLAVQVGTIPDPKSFSAAVINVDQTGGCQFCLDIQAYLAPIPKDSLSTEGSSNIKYVYSTDLSKAAIIIDNIEIGNDDPNGRCNIPKNTADNSASRSSLPDAVQAYLGLPGFTLAGGQTNPNACYYVAK
jgi:prepilin-type N-terminal cleavage/methylation domain-containing protein